MVAITRGDVVLCDLNPVEEVAKALRAILGL